MEKLYKKLENDISIKIHGATDDDAGFTQRKSEYRVYRGAVCVKVFYSSDEAEHYAAGITEKD